jgi:hypothetical protein
MRRSAAPSVGFGASSSLVPGVGTVTRARAVGVIGAVLARQEERDRAPGDASVLMRRQKTPRNTSTYAAQDPS